MRQVERDDYVIRVSPQELSKHLADLGFANLNQMPSNARRCDDIFGVSPDDLIDYFGRLHYRSQFMLPSFYHICLEAGVTEDDYANKARNWAETSFDCSAVELTRAGLDKVIPILRDKYHIILNIIQMLDLTGTVLHVTLFGM